MKCYDKRSQTGGADTGAEAESEAEVMPWSCRIQSTEAPKSKLGQQHLERTHAYGKVARRGWEDGRGRLAEAYMNIDLT